LRETQEYIQYRLNIASQKRLALFDRAAIRRIYAYSSGIPRMINIACDRALLTAFGMNRRKVTGRIAQAALAEITHRGRTPARGLMDGRKALALFVAVCAVAASLVYHKPLGDTLRGIVGGRPAAAPSGPAGAEVATAIAAAPLPSAGAEAETGTGAHTPAAPAPSARPGNTAGSAAGGTRLIDLLRQLEGRSSRMTALKEAVGAWGATVESRPYLESIDDDSTFFNLSAKAAGFFIQRVEAALELLLRLDMPAVLEFRSAAKGPSVYLALSGETETGIVLNGTGAAPLTAAADDIQQHWSGVAYIPWKNFLSIEGTIPGSAPPDSVVALKMLLRELGHRNLPLSREFDSATQKTIEQIQAQNGLPVDGVVGSLTKIVLYRDGKTFKVPRLTVK
jgi:general secretion pathway protein A